jgi:hypothetical protein
MRLKQDSAKKFYNSSEGTLHLVTVTSSYCPFAEPFAKEAPSVRSQGLLSSLPLPTTFYRSFARKPRAGAPKAIVSKASFYNSSSLSKTLRQKRITLMVWPYKPGIDFSKKKQYLERTQGKKIAGQDGLGPTLSCNLLRDESQWERK